MKGITVDLTENKHAVSQVVGVLVNDGVSAKEAISILEQAKETYLDRSYHINVKKKAD